MKRDKPARKYAVYYHRCKITDEILYIGKASEHWSVSGVLPIRTMFKRAYTHQGRAEEHIELLLSRRVYVEIAYIFNSDKEALDMEKLQIQIECPKLNKTHNPNWN